MKKYKIGMIGHGGFGSFCVENYQEMDNVEVAAVSGRHSNELEEFSKKYNIPFATTDYKEIINKPEIDIIAIMTPPYLHCQMAIECAKAKKAFLVEKPLAMSIKEANKILSAVSIHKVPATIGYVMRYSPIYDKVRSVTQEGRLGKLKRMIFENYASGHLPDSHWLFDKNKSGGLLVEHGVHFFDIFTSVVGKQPIKSASYTSSPREVLAMVEYPEKIIATFYHAFDKPAALERNYAKFVYENGYILVNGWIPMDIKIEYENDKGEIIIEEEKLGCTKNIEYRRLVKEVMNDLVSQIDNPLHKPKVTLQDARTSLELAIRSRDNRVF